MTGSIQSSGLQGDNDSSNTVLQTDILFDLFYLSTRLQNSRFFFSQNRLWRSVRIA